MIIAALQIVVALCLLGIFERYKVVFINRDMDLQYDFYKRANATMSEEAEVKGTEEAEVGRPMQLLPGTLVVCSCRHHAHVHAAASNT